MQIKKKIYINNILFPTCRMLKKNKSLLILQEITGNPSFSEKVCFEENKEEKPLPIDEHDNN
jgi:hypothetical protein